MIKLLLIDDEIELIEGLKETINWQEYGIEIIDEAYNGVRALEIIENLRPDIMLVDIRMPKMDGMELLEELNKRKIKIKSIVLSGYDDFYYAQKALKYEAVDYLLKPCRKEEILKSILKAKSLIEEEESKEGILENYKEQLKDNLPILKDNLLKNLIRGKALNKDKFFSKAYIYGINLDFTNISSALIHIDGLNNLYKEYKDEEIESLLIGISEVTKSNLNIHFKNEVFQVDEGIAIIYSSPSNLDYYLSIFNTFKNDISEKLKITVTIGVGNPVDSPFLLYKSFSNAISSLDAKFYLGNNMVIPYRDISSEDENKISYPGKEEREIINSINTGNKKHLNVSIEEFFNKLSSDNIPSKIYLEINSLFLVNSVYKFCIDRNLNLNNFFQDGFSYYDKIKSCETRNELKETIENIFLNIIDNIETYNNKNILVKEAVEYIKRNYSKDINLESLSKEIFITPGYLSILFKKELDVNFIEFLHKYRIEKAKELLENKLYKNYEVALKVGFKDDKYFSQLFKRYTGITPKEYRENFYNKK